MRNPLTGWHLRALCPRSTAFSLMLLLWTLAAAGPAQAGKWNLSVAYSGSFSVNYSGPANITCSPSSGGSISGGASSTTGGLTGSYTSALLVGLPNQGGIGRAVPSHRSAVALEEAARRNHRLARCLGGKFGQDSVTANLTMSGQMTLIVCTVVSFGKRNSIE